MSVSDHDPDPEPVEYGLTSEHAPTERALVAALQQGDVDAFRLLHQRYIVELLDFANTYLRSRDDAEEVVQDLFLWIWEHRHEWSAPGGVRAYCFKAVRNRAFNRLRQQRVQRRFAERLAQTAEPSGLEPSPPLNPLAHVTADELETIIACTVDTLPSRCREVFLLVRERRLSYAAVAQLLGIAPKTVENHMNSALGILRRRVAEWRGR